MAIELDLTCRRWFFSADSFCNEQEMRQKKRRLADRTTELEMYSLDCSRLDALIKSTFKFKSKITFDFHAQTSSGTAMSSRNKIN